MLVNLFNSWVCMFGTNWGTVASKALKASIEGGIQIDIQ